MSEQYILRAEGHEYPINLPQPGTGKSTFVFAPPKSGSEFLMNMMADVSLYAPQSLVNVPAFLFDHGVDPHSVKLEKARDLFERDGYCFVGFRDYPQMLREVKLQEHNRVFMMRDPRDMVVSNYYSMQQSHMIPQTGAISNALTMQRKAALETPIDDYILRYTVDYYRELLDRMVQIWKQPTIANSPAERKASRQAHRLTLLSVRYEDVVYQKADFLKRICQLFRWDIDPAVIQSVAGKQDIFPTDERPHKHIRQVAPGNFRKKLKPETIIELNEAFMPYLRIFGYSLI